MQAVVMLFLGFFGGGRLPPAARLACVGKQGMAGAGGGWQVVNLPAVWHRSVWQRYKGSFHEFLFNAGYANLFCDYWPALSCTLYLA